MTLGALEGAVKSGRISRERIDDSVRRLLEMKARVGLHKNRRVNLDHIGTVVASGDHLALADSAATRSVTLPRDRDGLIPADPRDYPRVLHVVYARDEDLTAGRALGASLGVYFRSLTTRRMSPDSPGAAYEELAWLRGEADLLLVSAFVPPRAGAGDVMVPEAFARFVEESSAGKSTVVVSLGNPYLLTAFPGVGTYLLAWGPHEVSQAAAARALVGVSAISGTLPVSLPPLHQRNEGLTRDRVPDVPRLGSMSEQELEIGLFRRGPGDRPAGPGGAEGQDPTISPLEVDPVEVGFDPKGLEALDSIIMAAIADSASPGAALAVGRRGKLVRLRGYGRLDWSPDAPRATPSSLWDMASVTKVSATTVAAMILAEAGHLNLDEKVVAYLPWWSAGDPEKEDVLVRHLLLHRAGLPPFRRFFLEMEGKEAYKDAIGALPLDYTPGGATVYSDIGLMTLAFIIEELTGADLDSFLRRRVWGPLGMQDTGFLPDPGLLPRIAPTEVDTTYRFTHVHGSVHDENAHAIGGIAGHAGLFSSARDMSVLAQVLLDGGSIPPCANVVDGGVPCSVARPGPVRIAAPTSVELFTRRHDSTSSRALGWDTPSEGSSSGEYFSDRAFGHTGFTGTSIWVDPELDLFVVLLTSRTNPTRSNSKHVPLRRAVHDAVAQAITDRPVQRRRR
ncbi:MAG: serine hydrolase [Gemmatimonadetes bacterium]|nr:serine hydrolase [Gemmatimonadota bacterium]